MAAHCCLSRLFLLQESNAADVVVEVHKHALDAPPISSEKLLHQLHRVEKPLGRAAAGFVQVSMLADCSPASGSCSHAYATRMVRVLAATGGILSDRTH